MLAEIAITNPTANGCNVRLMFILQETVPEIPGKSRGSDVCKSGAPDPDHVPILAHDDSTCRPLGPLEVPRVWPDTGSGRPVPHGSGIGRDRPTVTDPPPISGLPVDSP